MVGEVVSASFSRPGEASLCLVVMVREGGRGRGKEILGASSMTGERLRARAWEGALARTFQSLI